ncbi:hypothetical protein WDY80_00270 [Gordonia hongkongensis]|uniref:hypothetical protein n=1 Tax=Gordonia hongkongensis TaxID=1701090 RepID=UPI0030CDEF42
MASLADPGQRGEAGGRRPRTIRFYDDEAAYWSRFAEMLRLAIAEAEASERRTARRRPA